jgi:hypothetical protein
LSFAFPLLLVPAAAAVVAVAQSTISITQTHVRVALFQRNLLLFELLLGTNVQLAHFGLHLKVKGRMIGRHGEQKQELV